MSLPDQTDGTSDRELLDRAVQAHRDYYQEMSENWRHLDTKAQSSVPLVGILLTAFVAFATKGAGPSHWWDEALAVVVVFVLASSAVLFVVALSVRECDVPPYYGNLQDWLETCRAMPAECRASQLAIYSAKELGAWKASTASVQQVNDGKATWLRRAQICVLISIFLLVFFAVLQILKI